MSIFYSSIQVIRESISTITQVLAERDIPVYQRGLKAYVSYHPRTGEAKEVVLPYLPDDASEDLILGVQGFLDHEVGHILFTDNKEVVRIGHDPELSEMANIIEDPFVERKMRGRFPGSKENFNRLYEFFVRKIVEPNLETLKKNGEKDPFKYYGNLFPCIYRAWNDFDFFIDYMKDKWDLVKPITDKIQKLYPTVIEDLKSSKNTAENIAIAEKILAATMHVDSEFTDEEDKEDEPSKSEPKKEECADAESGDAEEGEGSGDSSSGSGSSKITDEEGFDEDDEPEDTDSTGSDTGSDEEESEIDEDEDDVSSDGDSSKEDTDDEDTDDEDPDDEDLSSSDGSDEDAESEKGCDEDAEIEESEESKDDIEEKDLMWTPKPEDKLSEASIGDMDSCMSREIGKEALEAAKNSEYTIYSTDLDIIEKAPVESTKASNGIKQITKCVDEYIGTMANSLQRAFIAENKSYWRGAQQSGKINPSSLARLKVGDTRVFRKKVEHKTQDYDVSLVIDCSGSMASSAGCGKTRIELALIAAYAMGCALDKIGVNFEIIGFTTKGRMEIDRELRSSGVKVGRSDILYMPIFKSFEERWSVEQWERIGTYYTSGHLWENVDGECVAIAARRLMRQKSKGKAMIVLSDGSPACSSEDYSALRRHLKKVTNEIERANVKLVGVGINTKSVREYYSNNIVIDKVEELPSILVSEVRRIILE